MVAVTAGRLQQCCLARLLAAGQTVREAYATAATSVTWKGVPMRVISVVVVVAAVSAGALGRGPFQARSTEQGASAEQCGQASAAQLRTTLYFGTARPKGAVSELEWQVFLRDEVTRRFPDGLTVWEAQGQWRTSGGTIDHERTKVLLLVHADTGTARAAVLEVIAKYRQAFDQQSVLWESARVCVAS